MSRVKRALIIISSVLLLLFGATLLIGGACLLFLGGSVYYFISGALLILSGLLYVRGDKRAERLYALTLVATLLWSLAEAGSNPWALLPRVFAMTVIAFWLAMPWIRAGLHGAPAQAGRNELAIAGILTLLVVVVLFARYPAGQDIDAPPPTGSAIASAADPSDTDWATYGDTSENKRFAEFSQINTGNVGRLEVAWVHRSGELAGFLRAAEDREKGGGHLGRPAGTRAEATPIKFGNILYTCGTYADVYAIDAMTGKEIWRSRSGAGPSYGFSVCRGVSLYHQPDTTGVCADRIIVAGPFGILRALDAKTGSPCQDFGQNGQISLLDHMGRVDPKQYPTTSPPAIIGGLIILGAFVSDNVDADMPSGVIKAFDAKSGALRWAWDMGAPGRVGAPPKGETYTRSTPNAWTIFAADEKLGLVYVPTGNPSPDFFGVRRRPFDEKYGSSLIALRVHDGRPAWSFQTTRHDLFDYDIASPPVLADVPGPHGMVPAVIQATKRGDIFVLDRRTGTPIVGVHDVPVPAGKMPGERYSRTQPASHISLVPPRLTEADMWGATPIDQMMCRIRFKQARYEGTFTPPGPDKALQYPGSMGTLNWGGVSIDETNKVLFTATISMPWLAQQIRRTTLADPDSMHGPQKGTPYVGDVEPFLGPLGMPCNQPPWGKLVAVDLKTQRVLWSKVVGTARDNGPLGIPTHLPLLMGLPSFGGPINTKGGVVFMAAMLDQYLRAFDARTGKLLWEGRLPAGGQATPMTYMARGRQYVVITAGGHSRAGTRMGDYTIAFALPRKR